MSLEDKYKFLCNKVGTKGATINRIRSYMMKVADESTLSKLRGLHHSSTYYTRIIDDKPFSGIKRCDKAILFIEICYKIIKEIETNGE